MRYLPSEIKPTTDLYRENPELRDFAKRFNLSRFVDVGFVIASQPQGHPDVTIYGLFVIDKQNVEKNLLNAASRCEIAQDFIAFNRKSGHYVYYSGRGSKDLNSNHQHIKLFCEEYGKHPDGTWGQYECSPKLYTPLHRMRDENDKYLPKEDWAQNLIRERMKEVRGSLAVC